MSEEREGFSFRQVEELQTEFIITIHHGHIDRFATIEYPHLGFCVLLHRAMTIQMIRRQI